VKKIPTLFVRDRATHLVTDEITPGCVWVFTEAGVRATKKWDGTCCLIRDGKLYKRYELKPGREAPADFEQEDFDEITGKAFGWLSVGEGPEDRWHRDAFSIGPWVDGTYELCGPKVQGNPERFMRHGLFLHGGAKVFFHGKPYRDVLVKFFEENNIEGIVFYGSDGKRAKIKGRDFGIKRGEGKG
jgi:hypothetical protein